MGRRPFMIAVVSFLAGQSQAASLDLTGIWGGRQAVLTVTADGARLEAACAQGGITGPIRLDRRGRFTAQGSFEAFTGGPQRADGEGLASARYSGEVHGSTMTLVVRAAGVPPEVLTLTRGVRPKLVRCY